MTTAGADHHRSERIGVLAAALAAISFGAAFPATAVALRAWEPLAGAATYSTGALVMLVVLAVVGVLLLLARPLVGDLHLVEIGLPLPPAPVEVLTDAWRTAAPPRLVREHDA